MYVTNTMNSPANSSKLIQHGFEGITSWVPYKDRIRPASLDWEEASGWIYAFVTSNRVRYIGMTARVLRSRLDNYGYQVGEPMRDRILQCLQEGMSVEIFGFRRPNLEEAEIKKEESHLIAVFGPDWNVRE